LGGYPPDKHELISFSFVQDWMLGNTSALSTARCHCSPIFACGL